MSTGNFEYKVDGINDEWQPANPTPRWRQALDAAVDLLPVTEVAFTLGTSDGLNPVVIRYREVPDEEG